MKKFYSLLLTILGILNLIAGTAIYDPAIPEASEIGSNTLTWIPQGNLTPKIMKSSDGLFVSYTGTRGTARISFHGMELQVPETMDAAGLHIILDVTRKGKLSFNALFNDKTNAIFSVLLKEGRNNFVIWNRQFVRHSKESIDWMKLSRFCLDSNDPKLVFTLRKVEVFARPSIAKGNIPPIYDAAAPEIYSVSHYTQKWIPNSNLKPEAKVKDGVLEISYKGNSGRARSNFFVPSLELLPSSTEIAGIRIILDSNGDRFEKLNIETFFHDHTGAQFQAVLLPGMRSYELTAPVFRRAKNPVNWRKLASINIDNKNPKLCLKIKKIELIVKEASLKKQKISAFTSRCVAEVLPDGYPAKPIPLGMDFKLQKNLPATLIPSVMYLMKSRDALQIKVCSKFATRPVAKVMDADGPVFQDEALELLFSPWLSNIKFMQFAVNAAGTVYDQKRDFDDTAAGIIYNKKWNLDHTKTLNFTGSEMVYKIKIPFQSLQFDIKKQPMLGFQAVQGYGEKRPTSTVSWNPATFFPNPQNFGVLLFNEIPFGEGTLSIRKLETLSSKLPQVMTLCVTFSADHIPEGIYTVKLNVTSPGDEHFSKTERLQLAAGRMIRTEIELARRNGLHTLYLRLEKQPGCALLTAVDFFNREELQSKFGQINLCPEVKQYHLRKDVFAINQNISIGVSDQATERTRITARLFANEFCAYTGIDNKIGNDTAAIELKVDSSQNLPPEGYTLEITTGKIALKGQDEAGLYHATRTLMQILKSPMYRGPIRSLPTLTIRDWPDCPNRVFRICHPGKFKGTVPKDPLTVDCILDYLQRYVADLKYNVLLLDLGTITRFRRRSEFNGPERVITLEDWRKIADFCRSHFILLIPQLQFGSHEIAWMLSYHPHLAMPGWRYTGDIRNPEHNKILFDCMDDLLEVTGAKWFMPKLDEFYHIRSNEPLLPDADYRNSFIRFLKTVYAELKCRKVGMMMFDDMLFPFTNGAKFNCYKVIDEVPRDIVILHWGGRPFDTAVRYFTARGFEVWNSGTSFIEYGSDTLKLLKGFGASPYNLGLPPGLRDDGGTCTSFQPVFHAADVAWNLSRPQGHPSIVDRLTDGTLPAWRAIAAEQPDPAASNQTFLIDLKPYFNETLSNFVKNNKPEFIPKMPGGRQIIGNIPMSTSDGILRLDRFSNISIPIKSSASSISFLLTGWYSAAKGANIHSFYSGRTLSSYTYGYPAGVFEISYTDKTKAEQPMKLHVQFDWIDTDPLYRATSRSRYVMPVDAGNGRNCFFYQVEWINPFPEKKIEQINYRPAKDFDFVLLLSAITLRLPKTGELHEHY